MQPNQLPPQNSIDYLNSISTPERVKTANPWLIWLMIGGVIVIAIVAALILINGLGTKSADINSVTQRVQLLQKTTEDQQENVKSSQLLTYNSSLSAVLTTTSRDASALIGEDAVKELEKTAETSVAATDMSELNGELDDARLNGIFDRVYAREMAYHIGLLRSELRQVGAANSSQALRDFVTNSEASLQPLQTNFSTFSDSEN